MGYVTINELTKLIDAKVLASLAYDKETGTPDIADPDVVQELNSLIESASGMVDGYLMAFHEVPLTGTIDPALKKHTAELVIDLAFQRRPGEAENPRARHAEAAFEWLEAVRAGIIKLKVEGQVERQRTIKSTTEDTEPTFTAETLGVLA